MSKAALDFFIIFLLVEWIVPGLLENFGVPALGSRIVILVLFGMYALARAAFAQRGEPSQ